MIGFPDFILDSKELDDVYDGVSQQMSLASQNFYPVLNDFQHDWKKLKWFKYLK